MRRPDDPGRIKSELAISGAWPLPSNYPTREQAAVAATHQLGEVGDEVYLHGSKCFDPDDCRCHPTVMVLTASGWRFGEDMR